MKYVYVINYTSDEKHTKLSMKKVLTDIFVKNYKPIKRSHSISDRTIDRLVRLRTKRRTIRNNEIGKQILIAEGNLSSNFYVSSLILY